MAQLATAIGSVIALIALGVLLRRVGLLAPSDNESFNKVIVYLALPALVFLGVYRAGLDWRYAAITAAAWATMLACLGLAFVVGRALRLTGPTLGGFLLVAGLGNTGYLGFPLTIALFGRTELPKAFFYDLFGTALALLTVGVLIGQHYGSSDEKTSVVREILTFPPLIAVVLGLAAKVVTLPVFLTQALDHLANLTVPLVMLTIGVSLERKAFGEYPRPLAATVATKLVLSPAIAWGLWTALAATGLLGAGAAGAIAGSAAAGAGSSGAAVATALASPTTAAIVVLEASMPSMMLSYVMGLRYRLDVSFIPSAVLLTTVLSLLTVPVWQVAVKALG